MRGDNFRSERENYAGINIWRVAAGADLIRPNNEYSAIGYGLKVEGEIIFYQFGR